jgi:uncharacterized protein YndB with AHSA1/START domain
MEDTTQVGLTTFTRPNDTQLRATRVIDASRDLVWAAHTDCEHVPKWLLGPEGWNMPGCIMDLRPGGKWSYSFNGPDDDGFTLRGEYKEIEAPTRIVQTETMEGAPMAVETVNTLVLSEVDGGTLLTTTVDYPSTELREQIIATGMMDGWAESYERLQKYLDSLG